MQGLVTLMLRFFVFHTKVGGSDSDSLRISNYLVKSYCLNLGSASTPFGFAQGKPFGFAQGKPFGFAQGKPFGVTQRAPSDVEGGKSLGVRVQGSVSFVSLVAPISLVFPQPGTFDDLEKALVKASTKASR
jgi:hypothetical protein